MIDNKKIYDKLYNDGKLSHDEWIKILSDYTSEDRKYAKDLAREIAQKNFGKSIYIRGIVEFSNFCRNDCLYCGIRKSNLNAQRYRLSKEEILQCCDEGYGYGFRTFVLQSGEDGFFSSQVMADIIREIKALHEDCAVTLSLGEMSREDYQILFDAGADRYLLRHETANEEHYRKLHLEKMSLKNRMECLENLKEIGYQVGAGMMIGSPFQSVDELCDDMEFLSRFKPHMIGTGPFIPHKDTPFAREEMGSYELTLYVLSLCRIMLPNVLLPATTALGTINPKGREEGVLCGANVIMPNLSPMAVRKKYLLYDNKAGTAEESSQVMENLKKRMESIGYDIKISRGDYKEND